MSRPEKHLSGALGIFRQLLLGLAEIHSVGIVHQDLKPGSLLLDRQTGCLKLIDFSLARVSVVAVPVKQSTRPGLIGTLGYVAPEQRVGSVPHTSADLFSAGAILLELSAAVLAPFNSAMERAEAFANLIRNHVPSALINLPYSALVLQLVDIDPAARPTARQALLEFDRVLNNCVPEL